MDCAICKNSFKVNDLTTIRESWILDGGWGTIPESAIAHPACDSREQKDLKSGKIKLSDLWTKLEKKPSDSSGAY